MNISRDITNQKRYFVNNKGELVKKIGRRYYIVNGVKNLRKYRVPVLTNIK